MDRYDLRDILMPPNKCGFMVNISHPIIAEFYREYKKRKNLPPTMPISDSERLEFEKEIMKTINRKD